MASDLVTPKEKSFAKPVKTLAVPNTFFEPEQEVTLTMTSKETKDEESSLETFVSALERLLESPEGTQEETLLEIANDFNPQELKNPLSNSLSSVSAPLNALSACCRDVLESTKNDDALPAELLATINMLPGDNVEPGPVGPICQGQEKSSSVSGGNGCLEVQPTMSQIDEDCTQIVQVNSVSLLPYHINSSGYPSCGTTSVSRTSGCAQYKYIGIIFVVIGNNRHCIKFKSSHQIPTSGRYCVTFTHRLLLLEVLGRVYKGLR